ncbi:MAG: K+/H+ antiporter [Betaproteobacteria bacterium RIFCSPLOWO2_12_FULL_65_14]|nr:MAG: K+/H+ antiporter [Betaproteobacteria bacterium RIFCSPLOWO2_12_FULL_65_14]
MEFWNTAIFIGALLLLISIVASDISSRMGAPLLLVFLFLGMLAGEDGPGGIRFDDFETAYVIGTLALAVILFDGGMRTRRERFRVALWPAVSLATVGVIVTAALVGLFAAWALGLHWLQGMLLGAIVGSTDAAAVFALLRTQGAALKERVAATLEIESGSNDPMAIFLTVALLELLAAGRTQLEVSIAAALLMQLGIGAALGFAGGKLLVWLINRLRLVTGLYPLLAAAGGLLIYAATAHLGGSGFLAIYLAGLVLGNAQLQAAQNILRMHDGLAWLSQIAMFLILGLLITPSQLLDIALPALGIAAFLMLVARPLSVVLSLLPFQFPWREQLYIGWVGLRGAVPIVLALFPMMYGIEDARLYFNVAFFIVLVSLLLQGWTIAPAARLLRLEVPPAIEPLQRVTLDMPGHFEHEIMAYEVQPGSLIAGRDLAAVELPEAMRLMAVMRDGRPQHLAAGLKFAPRDYVYFLAEPKSLPQLNRLFDPRQAPDRLEEQRYFGDFVLHGDAVLGELAEIYGIEVPESASRKTLAEYLKDLFHGRVVVGDRAALGSAELVVREIQGGRVSRVGLKLR